MLLLLLLLLLPFFIEAAAAARGRPRNVLLLLSDDLRPALGCYGDAGAVTPNLDALAGVSDVYTSAHAQQALCGPSRSGR